jgi:hypothetical protein
MMPSSARYLCGEREPSPANTFLPSGHSSLLDMINFSVLTFINYLNIIEYERADAGLAPSGAAINDDQRSRIKNNVAAVAEFMSKHGFVRTPDRFVYLDRELKKQILRYDTLYTQLTVFREAILDDIKDEYFFRYHRDKAAIYRSRSREWEQTIKKFRACSEEIDAAIDCHALGYNTASVFHLMRIAENGLRALSHSLQVSFPKTGTPIEWAQWQELIDQIRSKGGQHANALPKGEGRDAARDFYSGAVGQFEGFKDKYRNAVMHVRASYTELDALSAMHHVRDFMNGLSRKIGQNTKKQITRWP